MVFDPVSIIGYVGTAAGLVGFLATTVARLEKLGRGKTSLIDRLASCGRTQIFRVTSDNLRSMTETASATARVPTLFIVFDLGRLAPAKGLDARSTDSHLLRQLLDDVRGSQTLVVAETRHPNEIDESLRAPNRFGTEIEVSVPAANERNIILRAIRGSWDQPSDELIDDLVGRTLFRPCTGSRLSSYTASTNRAIFPESATCCMALCGQEVTGVY
jgi:SpoVK/Ycf46/Vps4 family AAA+-type ATPase